MLSTLNTPNLMGDGGNHSPHTTTTTTTTAERGRVSNDQSSRDGTNTTRQSNSSISSSSRDEGYAADWESLASKNSFTTAPRPPEELHLRNHQHNFRAHQQQLLQQYASKSESKCLHHHQHHHVGAAHKATKRPKLTEAVFAAHNARMYLEAAGEPVPKLCVVDQPPRATIPLATTIDVSHVSFLYSSQLPSTDGPQSLLQQTNTWHNEMSSKSPEDQKAILPNSMLPSQDLQMKVEQPHYGSDAYIKELLKITATFYENTTDPSGTCSETESITSSMSDSESDFGSLDRIIRRATLAPTAADMMALHVLTATIPLLDQTHPSMMCHSMNPEVVILQPLCHLLPKPEGTATVQIPPPKVVFPSAVLPSCAITMGDALDVCQHGRLVVTGMPPFRVVHANAALMRINGCGSHEIVGQPLSRLLVLTHTDATLQGSFGEELVVSVRRFSDDMTTKNAPPLGSISSSSSSSSSSSISDNSPVVSCTMKILPIVSDVTSQTEKSDQKCITHLCIDLVANNTADMMSSRFAREDLALAYVMG